MRFIKVLTVAASLAYGALAAPAKAPTKAGNGTDTVRHPPPKNPQIYDWREEPWAYYTMDHPLDRMYPVDMKKGTYFETSKRL